MFPIRFVPLLAVFLLATPRPGAWAEEEEEEAGPQGRVDALVRKAGIQPDGPGVGILVVTPKGVQVKKGYGLANLATKSRIRTDTTFELASVSKQMCGSAVLLLVQRGKVRVSDDVRKHLPELPVYDAEHPITVDHLSRHTSGLPDYLSWEGAEPKKGYLVNADAVAEFAKRKESSPLVFVPGEKYEYSNSGYMLLGALVEKLSGQTFGQFLAKEYFQPLGMKTAWVHESPAVPTATTAVGYTSDGDGWTPTWAAPTKEKHEKLFTTGDGSVWASLDDLAAWDHGMRTSTPVKAETWDAALVPGKTNGGDRVAYAMGWNVEYGDGDDVSSIYHTGKWGGFENYITHDVGRSITVVVLCNRAGFEAGDFANAVAAIFQD
jgi:CubicO group peptidase (beta-lactamase class C family)